MGEVLANLSFVIAGTKVFRAVTQPDFVSVVGQKYVGKC